MEYQDLKNYGQLYTGKMSAGVLMHAITSVPSELGFIGSTKFLTQLQAKERHWRRVEFKALVERGVTDPDVVAAMRANLAFYTALVASRGREKAAAIYPRIAERLGPMIYEEFLPSAEDFLGCSDVWGAIRGYFREFFRVVEREGVGRIKAVLDTDSEFRVRYDDCVWHAVACEAGYRELMPITARADVIHLPRLMRAVGGDFRRDCWLCDGDCVCDWRFLRHQTAE